jgi:hypothetical protein
LRYIAFRKVVFHRVNSQHDKNMQNKKTVFAMVIALAGNTLINYLTEIFVDKFGTSVYL